MIMLRSLRTLLALMKCTLGILNTITATKLTFQGHTIKWSLATEGMKLATNLIYIMLTILKLMVLHSRLWRLVSSDNRNTCYLDRDAKLKKLRDIKK